MRTVVVLFPGAWGNDTVEQVHWWFQYQIQAILRVDQNAEIVTVTYRGASFDEVVRNAIGTLCGLDRRDRQFVALAYSMGRQVLAAVLEYPSRVPRFERVAHIAGVPSYGVPVGGTFDVARAAPGFFFRSFLGTVLPGCVDEANAVMCSGQDRALAEELVRHMSPEPMWWKVANLFVPGFRRQTVPISVPVHAVVGDGDLIVGRATYDDNVEVLAHIEGGHHALIRSHRRELGHVWHDQARFLLEA